MRVQPSQLPAKAAVVLVPKRLMADAAALHSARYFAAGGYACEVLELSRSPRQLVDMSSAEVLDAAAKVRQAARKLKREEGLARVGVIGAWVGGTLALLASDCEADACAVVCPYVHLPLGTGSEVPEPLDAASRASMPIMAVFGELDAEVPLEDVRALERVLSDSQREDQTYTYPGVGHAFFDNETGNREYREAAERDLWQRIVRFFESSMG